MAYRPNYTELIDIYADAHGVDANLVSAIMRQESGFDKNALSNKGAVGLMQLMPTTAEWVAKKHKLAEYDLTLPKDNINIAVLYIKYLYDKYNDVNHVILAYNAGEGRVDNWLQLSNGELLQNIPFEETKAYYKKVIKNYKIYDFYS